MATLEAVQQQGSEAVCLSADLSDESSVSEFSDRCWSSLGTIDTWVNNAGEDVLTGDKTTASFQEKLRRLFDVDVIGTIALSRLVAERMLDQTLTLPPSITFIGWDQAPFGMEGDAGQMFAPVKAAVMSFAQSLAQTLAPNVRVNTIAPGWIQTAWGQDQPVGDYWDQRAKGQSLRERWGSAEDVASAIAFVCKPSNDFINGQVIEVNGGWNRKYLERAKK